GRDPPGARREAAGDPQEWTAGVRGSRDGDRARGRARRAEGLADGSERRILRAGAEVRTAGAEGAAAAGCAGLREIADRQGHRLAVGAAAAAARPGTDLLQPDRLVGGTSAASDPRGGERLARDPLDRR